MVLVVLLCCDEHVCMCVLCALAFDFNPVHHCSSQVWKQQKVYSITVVAVKRFKGAHTKSSIRVIKNRFSHLSVSTTATLPIHENRRRSVAVAFNALWLIEM
jgi:hypothetical protein